MQRLSAEIERELTMAKTTKSGKVKTSELPGTLQRSDEKAQHTYAKTLDSAE